MLKRLFLSLIIVSALASSEGGAYSSVELIDFYLANFIPADIVQRSIGLNSQIEDLGSQIKSKTPISSFKQISSQLLLKYQDKVKNIYLPFVTEKAFLLAMILVALLCFVHISSVTRKSVLFSLTDNSPPMLI